MKYVHIGNELPFSLHSHSFVNNEGQNLDDDMEIVAYSNSYNLVRLFAKHVGCLAVWVKF